VNSRKEIAIAVVMRGNDVLIGQRGHNVPLPGLWEFPGGKIEQGESPAAAAIRECIEETGLEVEMTRPLQVINHDYPEFSVRLHFFLCHLKENSASTLAGGFSWRSRFDLQNLEFPSANTPVIADLTAGEFC